MTLVRENYEVQQRGKERFELVVLLFAEAGVEKGFDPADDACRGDVGSRWGRRQQLARLAIEAAGEVVQKLHPTSDRRIAAGPRLDHEGAGGVRLADGEAEQGS